MSDPDGHHPHKRRKQIVDRLARVEGHVRAVKMMADSGRDCPELLLQLAAIKKAVDAVAKVILQDHLEQCVVDAVNTGDRDQVIGDLKVALDRYIR